MPDQGVFGPLTKAAIAAALSDSSPTETTTSSPVTSAPVVSSIPASNPDTTTIQSQIDALQREISQTNQINSLSNVTLSSPTISSPNISGLTTSSVAEGTNLYFTNARAEAALALLGATTTAGTGLTYSGNAFSLDLTHPNIFTGLQQFNGQASSTLFSATTGFFNNILTTLTTATSSFLGGFTAGNNAAFVVNQAAPANSLTISPSGNVGIGTTTPGANLDVNGNANIGGTLSIGTTVQTNSSAAYDGASLGPELTSSGCWTLGTGWSGTQAGGFTHTPGNTAPLTCAITTVNGATYQVGFTFTRPTAGQLSVSIGGTTYLTGLQNPGAIQNWQIAGGSGNFVFTPTSSYDGTISTESIELLTLASAVSTLKDSSGAVSSETRISSASLHNQFLGVSAGHSNTTGSGNSGFGYGALSLNVLSPQNTCIGYLCLSSLTSGVGLNTAVGYRAMLDTTTGYENVAVGNDSLEQNTTGTINVAVGQDALNSLTVGNDNTAVGGTAMQLATTANYNSAFGFESLYNLTTARYSTAVGFQAGKLIGTGAANQTSWNSTYLGSNTRANADGDINEIVIGGGSTVTIGAGSNTVTIGNSDITKTLLSGNVGIGTTSPTHLLDVGSNSVSGAVAGFENSTGQCIINPTSSSVNCTSDARLKKNINPMATSTSLANILSLNPVFFNWNSESATSSQHSGFIAQQVAPIFPDLVTQDSSSGYYLLNYAGLTPYLTKAIQDIANLGSDFTSTLVAWLGNAANGIADLYATIIHAHEVHTDTLCVGTTCVTPQQFQAMVAASGQIASPPPIVAPAASDVQATSTNATSTLTDSNSLQSDVASTTTPDTLSDSTDIASSTPVITNDASTSPTQ